MGVGTRPALVSELGYRKTCATKQRGELTGENFEMISKTEKVSWLVGEREPQTRSRQADADL